MKTNKSYTKRLRLTRRGKVVARVPGHNHFNAKRSGGERMRKHRSASLHLTQQEKSRFLNG